MGIWKAKDGQMVRPHVIVTGVSVVVGLAVIGSVVALFHFFFPLYSTPEEEQAWRQLRDNEIEEVRLYRTSVERQELREMVERHRVWDKTARDGAPVSIPETDRIGDPAGDITMSGEAVAPPMDSLRQGKFLLITPAFPVSGLELKELRVREYESEVFMALYVSPKRLSEEGVVEWYRKTMASYSYETIEDAKLSNETVMRFRSSNRSGLTEIEVIIVPLPARGMTGVFARLSWDPDTVIDLIPVPSTKKEWWTDRIIAGWFRSYVENQPR